MALSQAQSARNHLAALIRSKADPELILAARAQLAAIVTETKIRDLAGMTLTPQQRIDAARLILTGSGQ
jgi:hypothetical protein